MIKYKLNFGLRPSFEVTSNLDYTHAMNNFHDFCYELYDIYPHKMVPAIGYSLKYKHVEVLISEKLWPVVFKLFICNNNANLIYYKPVLKMRKSKFILNYFINKIYEEIDIFEEIQINE